MGDKKFLGCTRPVTSRSFYLYLCMCGGRETEDVEHEVRKVSFEATHTRVVGRSQKLAAPLVGLTYDGGYHSGVASSLEHHRFRVR